jgi:type II secretory pathway pseudopilin PulG
VIQNSRFKILNSKLKTGGFGLLEVIIALSIFSMGMFSAMAALSLALRSATTSQYNLVAAALAQEGIEYIRNKRDTNWLNFTDPTRWNHQIDPGVYRFRWDNPNLNSNEPTLKIRYRDLDSGFSYIGAPAYDTIYSRTVTITQISPDEMQIVVTVSWNDRGRTRSISTEEHLLNWK